jgi:hypothetical protein
MDQIFARVENGVVVEYPVYMSHITARAHPLDWYTPVTPLAKPDPQPFTTQREIPVYRDDRVYIDYLVSPFTMSDMLTWFVDPSSLPVAPGGDTKPKSIDVIGLDGLEVFQQLLAKYCESQLDTFAQTRDYASFLSLVSYVNSTNKTYSKEAKDALGLRDQLWVSYYAYVGKLRSGELELPLSIQQCNRYLTVLDWPK